jgi:hypothetical protein
MIPYFGLPITPTTAAYHAIKSGHAFVSFAHKDQLKEAVSHSQSFAIDNGAFSAWRSGNPVRDWEPFYDWAEWCLKFPHCDFAVIPDVIDGRESDNDAMLNDCPLPKWNSAPVYHMHESLDRLARLASDYPRICLGSSGSYSTIGTNEWWHRMDEMMGVVCDKDGRPLVKMHGLRMLNPDVYTKIPLASADSTNIGRNIGIDKSWTGTHIPPTKETRALNMRAEVEHYNASANNYVNQSRGSNLCLF